MIRTIDSYLDRLFDLLAGTGAPGRRLLNETEGHLTAAVEAELAKGHDTNEAEARAIARFGTPEQVASAYVSQSRLPLPMAIMRLVAAAWFFLGCTGVMFGIGGALTAGTAALFGPEFVSPDLHHAAYTPERCGELAALYPDIASCEAASIAQNVDEIIGNMVWLGVYGIVLLAAFGLARRSRHLRRFTFLPNATMVAAVGAVGYGLLGFGGLGAGLMMMLDGAQPGAGANLALGLAGFLAFALFFPAAWRHLRQT